MINIEKLLNICQIGVIIYHNLGGIYVKNSNTTKNLFKNHITPAMHGFNLIITNNSYLYTRKETECIQQIEFIPHISINNGEIVYFKIYPRINVYFKKVNNITKNIFETCLSEICMENSINDSTYSAPLDIILKKEKQKKVPVILTYSDCLNEITHVMSIVSENALPLLDKLKTTDDLIDCWENKIIMYPYRFAIYIVGAYMLKGKTEKVIEIAEEYFKKTNNIPVYEAIINYIKKTT